MKGKDKNKTNQPNDTEQARENSKRKKNGKRKGEYDDDGRQLHCSSNQTATENGMKI